ncbi:hypothetical protein PIGHUM_01653 [Pigmentiphaga humi]|uniref:Iron-containing redox enzyme n=1 Tax=Pigmentiphaga humi TaxID=2478468 RepID=A0A3P4B1M0_9BURK|nr:iron-containing redox enzyme family protein [Pigmentiphaga humi]VCU69590.1 hypothetical protein PIGHUM_01653 [Pigmentiphaga humi]
MFSDTAVEFPLSPCLPSLPQPAVYDTARSLYENLYSATPDAGIRARAGKFLDASLEAVRALPNDMPATPQACGAWMEAKSAHTAQRYAEYLAARQSGAPRQYFSSEAHALYFLNEIAPTKLVDGAWLAGLVTQWEDSRFHPLIRTYLEELGDGAPELNHVVLYRRLLDAHACGHRDGMADSRFVQGAIQLALGCNADKYLPEIIGFNLGYEQLPLHLPITAYELNELGIDPYYFTLHITIDNMATGHARRALDALQLTLPARHRAAFFERVRNGYMLNELGDGSESIIRDFDLEQEVIAIFKRKSVFGRHMHSDYCKLAGKSVNAWLADPGQIPAFLDQLQRGGWIRRNQDPAASRFWRLLAGERAEMFGVFTDYEIRVIHDWIAGEWKDPQLQVPSRALSYRARRRMEEADTGLPAPEDADNDFNEPLRRLCADLDEADSKRERMRMLLPYLGPASHHTPEGLLATRLFSQGLRGGAS